ncbi:hypothetical protein Vafri_19617 [Volvox africanus]|uniref:Uncharacterized protein n=1 Tax=Volvox africanus TaxID=51714 RepID=A0A8J4BNK2_9CHLO|nr:hypothetical protein Vafri_19617 [Volvox africanus]
MLGQKCSTGGIVSAMSCILQHEDTTHLAGKPWRRRSYGSRRPRLRCADDTARAGHPRHNLAAPDLHQPQLLLLLLFGLELRECCGGLRGHLEEVQGEPALLEQVPAARHLELQRQILVVVRRGRTLPLRDAWCRNSTLEPRPGASPRDMKLRMR